MNRFEFSACGYMMFGSEWKTDLTKTLKFSEKSNTVGKIFRNERGVSDSLALELIEAMEKKAQDLIDAASFLKNPTQHLIKKSKFDVITFDEFGVRQWDGFQEFPISELGVVLHNAELGVPESDLKFQSLVVGAAASSALKAGNNQELLKLLPVYFDFSQFPDFNINSFGIGV